MLWELVFLVPGERGGGHLLGGRRPRSSGQPVPAGDKDLSLCLTVTLTRGQAEAHPSQQPSWPAQLSQL